MSAGSPRFEVVRSKAGWHGRFVAANGRIIWHTENYNRRRNVIAAVELIAGRITESPHALWPEVPNPHRDYPLEIRDVDERPPPPAPPTIEPPFYLSQRFDGGKFWHDSEYHYRQCYGDECTEGTPPNRAVVAGRRGYVTFEVSP